MSDIPGIVPVPSHRIDAVGAAVIIAITASLAGSVPFIFGRQPKTFAGLAVQTLDELLHVIPTDLFHRAVVATTRKLRRVIAHHRPLLALGDFGFAHFDAGG